MNKSKGHRAEIGKYEYFMRNGDLYCAPLSYPVMPDGYRCGRLETAGHLADDWLAFLAANSQ